MKSCISCGGCSNPIPRAKAPNTGLDQKTITFLSWVVSSWISSSSTPSCLLVEVRALGLCVNLSFCQVPAFDQIPHRGRARFAGGGGPLCGTGCGGTGSVFQLGARLIRSTVLLPMCSQSVFGSCDAPSQPLPKPQTLHLQSRMKVSASHRWTDELWSPARRNHAERRAHPGAVALGRWVYARKLSLETLLTMIVFPR